MIEFLSAALPFVTFGCAIIGTTLLAVVAISYLRDIKRRKIVNRIINQTTEEKH